MRSFRDMKIKYKLAVIYLITGILPVLVLFCYSYNQMRANLLEQQNKTIQNFVDQSTTSMDNQIQIYNNLSNYITFNESISRIVSYDYKSDYDRYTQFVQVLDPMLSSLRYFHDDVNKVTIYTDLSIKHDTTIAPITEIQSQPWYQIASGSTMIHWFADQKNKTMISARKMSMLSEQNMLGILCISVDYNQLFLPFEQKSWDNYGIFITDENDNLVYQFHKFDNEYSSKQMEFDTFEEKLGKNTISEDYTMMQQNSDSTGWTIYLYEPNGLAVRSTKPMIFMISLSAAVALAALIIAIFSVSRFITGRLAKLQTNMREVEKGNMHIQVKNDGNDEIGDMIDGYNKMIGQINTLITEVYQGKISQKEYEMRALRAQINPHFLYNSLSLINWKAIASDQQEISNITLALSNYYRTSLNKGRNTLSLEMELSNMTSYLQIQQIMHDYNFDVNINVSPEIMGYEVLNLILQPIVENAIDHGIDLKSDGRGVISVDGRLDETDHTIVVEVTDNGVGMDKETIQTMLQESSKGYGIRNVNERIMLYYGEQYSMHVESEIGKGTKVSIRIPAIKYEPK